MAHITSQLSKTEIKEFFQKCSTIGAYTLFPGNQVDGKMTINDSRGTNRMIKDRFDLTLECIRRYYANEDSPLRETLGRYPEFFELFGDFKGYIEFFLLQDLTGDDFSSIKFWLEFCDFQHSPLPKDISEYKTYRERVIDFVTLRNQRIEKLCPA